MEDSLSSPLPKRRLGRLKKAKETATSHVERSPLQPLQPVNSYLKSPPHIQSSHRKSRNVGGGSSSLRNVTEAVKQSSDYGCKDSKNEGSQPKACTPSHDSSRMEKGLSAFKDEGASPENKLYQQKPSGDVPQASGDKDQESNDGVSQASGDNNRSDADAASPSARPAEGERYWDEEDELEDYVKRALAKFASKSPTGSHCGSDGSTAGEGGEGDGKAQGSQADSDDEASCGESPAQLAGADLQKKLRDEAQREGIGRAAAPEIKPMNDVLAKIRAIADAAAARAAQTTRVDLPPPSARKPITPLQALQGDSEDDIIIESDEDFDTTEGGAQTTPAVPLRFAIGSETQQDSSLFVGKVAEREVERNDDTERGSNPGESSLTDNPNGIEPHFLEGNKTNFSHLRAVATAEQVPAKPEGQREEREGEDDEEEEEEDDELELESPSGESSSSSSDDEDEIDPEEARKAALAEARAMLQDQKGKNKDQYFEDEAEMSEDGGHSSDESDNEGEDEHTKLLEDLIGHEKERKRDEKLRAAAHAQWLAQQDEAEVQRLMDGMKNGFRKPKRPAFLMDEGGSLIESRKRRAALGGGPEGGDDEAGASEDESSSGSDSDTESDKEQAEPSQPINYADISDDEGKAALQRYQQQKVLEASQAEEQVDLDLLDEDSQAFLTRMGSDSRGCAVAEPRKPAEIDEIEGEWLVSKKASFLGRTAAATAAIRTNSQNNSRSYVFGREISNSVPAFEGEEESTGAAMKAPTNFTGIKRAALTMRSKPSGGSLLSMLHTKNAKAALAEPIHTKVDIANIVAQAKPKKEKLSRLR